MIAITNDSNMGGMTPTGTISITTNGTHDVTEYAEADVQVPGVVLSDINASLSRSTNSYMIRGSKTYRTVIPGQGYSTFKVYGESSRVGIYFQNSSGGTISSQTAASGGWRSYSIPSGTLTISTVTLDSNDNFWFALLV